METLAHPRRHRSGPAPLAGLIYIPAKNAKGLASLCSIFSFSFIFHRRLCVLSARPVSQSSPSSRTRNDDDKSDALTNIRFDFIKFVTTSLNIVNALRKIHATIPSMFKHIIIGICRKFQTYCIALWQAYLFFLPMSSIRQPHALGLPVVEDLLECSESAR